MGLTINKAWYKSKTIIGAIIALIGGVLNLNIDSTTVNDIGQAVSDTSSTTFASLMTLVGALVAIYGRATATEKITKS